MSQADVVDRNLAVARELRAAAEETRRAMQASHELVERSRRQTQASPESDYEYAADGDCSAPYELLIECLIEAYELAVDEGEPQTRALISQVLMHVGRRVARSLGPSVAKVAVH